MTEEDKCLTDRVGEREQFNIDVQKAKWMLCEMMKLVGRCRNRPSHFIKTIKPPFVSPPNCTSDRFDRESRKRERRTLSLLMKVTDCFKGISLAGTRKSKRRSRARENN